MSQADLVARLRASAEEVEAFPHPSHCDHLHMAFKVMREAADALEATKAAAPGTPAAAWRVNGELDPHAGRYDGERARLAMGDLTDDELANAAFMNYDVRPPLQEIMAGRAHSPIAYMMAVKDRIRWLSRKLVAALSPAIVGYRWRFREGKDNAWRLCERDPRGDNLVIECEALALAAPQASAEVV